MSIDTAYLDGKKNECCGCTACMSVCPRKAISMSPDDKGFLYPVIDKDKCIECGLCTRTCSFGKTSHKFHSDVPLKAYGAKHKDSDIRANSRSGGCFTAISDYVLENNGCVFGARLLDDLSVQHVLAESKSERDKMRGSKYVQSNLGNCFSVVKEKLEGGRLVLFSGTACQVDGLYAYLGRDYENLITIDIVCFGVPSPKVLRDYLMSVAKILEIS